MLKCAHRDSKVVNTSRVSLTSSVSFTASLLGLSSLITQFGTVVKPSASVFSNSTFKAGMDDSATSEGSTRKVSQWRRGRLVLPKFSR